MLNDETIMTFGKHQGKKLANVPAKWLLNWYNSDKVRFNSFQRGLRAYVEDNMEILIEE